MFNDLQDIMNIKVKESKRNFRNKNAISEMKNLLNEINLKSESAEERADGEKLKYGCTLPLLHSDCATGSS